MKKTFEIIKIIVKIIFKLVIFFININILFKINKIYKINFQY